MARQARAALRRPRLEATAHANSDVIVWRVIRKGDASRDSGASHSHECGASHAFLRDPSGREANRRQLVGQWAPLIPVQSRDVSLQRRRQLLPLNAYPHKKDVERQA